MGKNVVVIYSDHDEISMRLVISDTVRINSILSRPLFENIIGTYTLQYPVQFWHIFSVLQFRARLNVRFILSVDESRKTV